MVAIKHLRDGIRSKRDKENKIVISLIQLHIVFATERLRQTLYLDQLLRQQVQNFQEQQEKIKKQMGDETTKSLYNA